MPVVGTAGHVDHGKSTLIRALTGRDPDRWAEEKKRGLTIDLGFAWARLPSGVDVSFVDVPGHERFVKNMLAGIEMIDATLFVVACDEGWMPQSEEHLAVLDLLDVTSGVVALTKIDRVDDELAALAQLEVADRLRGTSLEGARIIPVSGTTGQGLDQLSAALDEAVAGGPVSAGDRPRVWVDRSFTVGGAGTVITGTLTGGHLQLEERVSIYPEGVAATVRGMQSHETEITRGEPGTRIAVNLRGLERTDVVRGAMLGRPGEWTLSKRFSASLRLARYVDELPSKGAYQAHIGSGAYPARIEQMGNGHLIVRLEVALPLQASDRFILRDTGRRQVVAGGVVLDVDPRKGRYGLADAAEVEAAVTPDQVADTLLRIRAVDELKRLANHSGGGTPAEAVLVGSRALSRSYVERLESEMTELIEEDHRRYPLRVGTRLATLAGRMGLDRDTVEFLVERDPRLRRDGPDVGVRSHSPALSAKQVEAWNAAERVLRSDLAVPGQHELGLDPELIHLKLRLGELVRVAEEYVVLPEQANLIENHIQSMSDGFTVAEFRDATGLSRKHSVPYLEWADARGLTVRRGDLRFRAGSDG
jgi:selenocysteine-specific elongation factor